MCFVNPIGGPILRLGFIAQAFTLLSPLGRTMTSPPRPSSASQQPMVNEAHAEPSAPDQEPWLLPKPDTCLFNIFGESFELQALKDKIAKGQMPHCLFKDPAAVDQQPLNRQEMWAAMQYKPIYRTSGRWTYWDLLVEDIRKPPPQFCNEIEDAPKQLPTSRTQPREKARPKHVPPSARPSPPPKMPQKDSWADGTEQEESSNPASKPTSVQEPKASSAVTSPPQPTAACTAEQKPEPPPQQHLRPPESQSFLPKEADPPIKAAPSKPPQTTQPPQVQPGSPDQPGSSNDGLKDLSASDPASVYMPLPGQDLDMDSFLSLLQPGAFTKPYVFDIGLLDGRAQPLFSQPTYKPIECMVFENRPWICYYGGSPPKEVAQIDDWWHTMYADDGGCYRVGLYSSYTISCAYFQIHNLAQSLRHKPMLQPRTPTETSSGRGSLSQPLVVPHPEGIGIKDAQGIITPAPLTHRPNRL